MQSANKLPKGWTQMRRSDFDHRRHLDPPLKEKNMATRNKTRRTGANLSYQGRKPVKRTRDNHKFDGMTITKLVLRNPRREGTAGWDDWKLIRNGMSFEAFKRAGGVRRILEENIARGFIRVR
jgi:hypothetical protein